MEGYENRGEVFRKGVRWIPRRNGNLSVWHDNWVPNGSFRTLIQGPLTVEDEAIRVKDVFGPQGWDWSRISFKLPSQVLILTPFLVLLELIM